MEITVEERGEITVVAPNDRLDLLGYLELEAVLGKLLRDGRKKLVLDMSGVNFINSTCMAVIHRYSLDARDKGGNLVLACAAESVKGILGLGGLDKLIPMCDTVDEAAEAAAEPAKKKDETDKHKAGGTKPRLTDTSMG